MPIRQAIEADLPRLMELLYELSQLGEIVESRPRTAGPLEQAALRALQADERFTCLVLDLDGRPDGTATLYILPNLSHGGRPYAVVENVVVDSRHRGAGLGRELMEHAERLAVEANCYKIVLTSNRHRIHAHRFYERLGYVATHHGFTKYLPE